MGTALGDTSFAGKAEDEDFGNMPYYLASLRWEFIAWALVQQRLKSKGAL